MIAKLLSFTFIALIALSAAAASELGDTIHNSRIGKSRYITVVKMKRLAATPEWRKDEEAPPLSNRKAAALATEQLLKLLKLKDNTAWPIVTISLEWSAVANRWYYCVSFRREGQDGIDWLQVVVFMDGTSPMIELVDDDKE